MKEINNIIFDRDSTRFAIKSTTIVLEVSKERKCTSGHCELIYKNGKFKLKNK